MHQPVPVVADVRAHLEVGEAAALLHEVARRAHVGDLEAHVLDGAHHLTLVLRASRRIIRIQRRELRFEIPVGTRRLDVVTACPRDVATASESKLVLIEGRDVVAAFRIDTDVLQMRRDATRVEHFPASERLFRAGKILDEIERRVVRADDPEHWIAVWPSID